MPRRPTATTYRDSTPLTVGSNPYADIAEQTPQNINLNTATPEQIAAYNTGIQAALYPSSQVQNTTEISLAGRQEAGAPLQSPTAGAMGKTGALGYSPATGGVTMTGEGMGIVPKTTRDAATPDPRAGLFDPAKNPYGGATAGGGLTAAEAAQVNAAGAARFKAEEETRIAQREEAIRKAQERMREGAATDAATGKAAPTSAKDAALLGQLGKYMPEMVPFMQDYLNEQRGISEENAAQFEAQYADLQKGYADIQGEFKNLTEMQQSMFGEIQDALKAEKENNDQIIAAQQEAADKRAKLEQDKAEVEMARNKEREHQNNIVQIALAGGGNQDAALDIVKEADRYYDSKMSDLRAEFSVQATERSAKFTQMYLENSNNYTRESTNNMKELMSGLERISLQSISSKESKMKAEMGLAEKHWDNEVSLRKEKANKTLEIGKMIQGSINDEKKFKRQEENEAWGRLEWFQKTYGAGTPQSVVDDLAKKLPGIDVKNFLTTPTLAEIAKQRKASGSGGGGGGKMSFASYEKKSDGRPPTFDDFVRLKEREALDSGATMFDSSPTAMAAYKKEYEVRLKEDARLDPNSIVTFMEDRIKNITEKNVRENIQDTVHRYISDGRYEEADNYVQGLGKTMSAEERKAFSKAAGAKQNVQRVSNLIDNMGSIGPVIGRFRQLNPYDDRVVEFNNLVTQTIPGLARGIFGEVGVLTDQDIATYTKTMANPTLTAEQARTATRNLMQTIEYSIQNQVDLARAAGVNTRDVGTYFGVDMRSEMIEPGISPDYESKKNDFLNSLPL